MPPGQSRAYGGWMLVYPWGLCAEAPDASGKDPPLKENRPLESAHRGPKKHALVVFEGDALDLPEPPMEAEFPLPVLQRDVQDAAEVGGLLDSALH